MTLSLSLGQHMLWKTGLQSRADPLLAVALKNLKGVGMAVEQTLAMIKPDAVQKGVIGEILNRIDGSSLKIVGIKMHHLTKAKAEGFYAVHKDKPFFASLVKFMSSGPSVAMVLEGDNAILRWRELMGATDPEKANADTLRHDFGANIENNAVHGSDSAVNAAAEIAYFFDKNDIVQYDWV